ncbi:GNAT family N-acetyltransferase [Paramicrobacterium chengjingii]|uniref:GNAT family N-acetyltransferase n=1 Tax=Paramicrobacterium chengjingii TaxID=2769067 RepID=A0ABX6YLI5_9MICO|nr:GNAT family N-acetyltransferase [Microbacterium chengjingii]QPZ39582.1 GNAT family N-acetyltransferase [Microbacterium chengjingii]
MSKCVNVRPATRADGATLTELDRHVRRDVLVRLIDAEQILVADEANTVRGWLRWNLFWDEIPFMNMLFVVETHRDCGVGSALVAAWESTLKKHGYVGAMTSTQVDERAQVFYRNRGYVDCGVLLQPGEPSEIFMRKDLD